MRFILFYITIEDAVSFLSIFFHFLIKIVSILASLLLLKAKGNLSYHISIMNKKTVFVSKVLCAII